MSDEPAGVGHNSILNTAGQLKSLIERVERLEEEKATLAEDIREVYGEAKGVGFDTKIMRRVVQLRKMSEADRQAAAAVLETYCAALGIGTSASVW
jgi:uncharacterized protein (UPF0335 family)